MSKLIALAIAQKKSGCVPYPTNLQCFGQGFAARALLPCLIPLCRFRLVKVAPAWASRQSHPIICETSSAHGRLFRRCPRGLLYTYGVLWCVGGYGYPMTRLPWGAGSTRMCFTPPRIHMGKRGVGVVVQQPWLNKRPTCWCKAWVLQCQHVWFRHCDSLP